MQVCTEVMVSCTEEDRKVTFPFPVEFIEKLFRKMNTTAFYFIYTNIYIYKIFNISAGLWSCLSHFCCCKVFTFIHQLIYRRNELMFEVILWLLLFFITTFAVHCL